MATKNTKFTFRIKRIDILGSEYLLRPGLGTDHNFTFEFSTEHGVISETGGVYSIIIAIVVKVFTEPEKKTRVAKIGVQFAYDIESSGIRKSRKGYHIPMKGYLGPMNIAIGTTRGIMFDKLLGTFLEHVYLPIMSPEDILKKICEDGFVVLKHVKPDLESKKRVVSPRKKKKS